MKVSVAQNIALIGFMATGKSTVGRALANSTSRQFFDTDTLVEKMAGKSITQIFNDEGEESFRKMESSVVREVCENESSVISFGGGVVLSSSNIETIRRRSLVVHLRAKVETILERTKSTKLRPLLTNDNEDSKERIITKMLDLRSSAYENAKDFAIDTDRLDTSEVVDEIKRRLEL